jgi:hypothetical protein
MKKQVSQVDIDNFLEHNFDKRVEEWLQKTNEIPETERDGVHDFMTGLREEYIKVQDSDENIDKEKLMSKYKRYITDARARVDDSIELRDHMALINNTSELTGAGWKKFKRSKLGQEFSSAMNGEKKMTWQGDMAGYIIDGSFMSIYDMRKVLDKNTFDVSSRNVINGVIDYAQMLGSYEDAGELDMYDIATKIRNEVVLKGNRYSLINDNHIPTENGSFKLDLVGRLQEMTYADLGITDEMINNIDENLGSVKVSDGINSDEAEVIADELLKDDELTNEYLTNYFAQHVKSQYDFLYGKPKQQDNSKDENEFA